MVDFPIACKVCKKVVIIGDKVYGEVYQDQGYYCSECHKKKKEEKGE